MFFQAYNLIKNKITRSFIMFKLMYLFININQYFATHPYGIIRNIEWMLKTLHWRCNEINLTSQINCTDSTDRRLLNVQIGSFFFGSFFLFRWFGVWSSTWTPSRWFQSHPTILDGDFCRWSESGGWSSCLVCCVVLHAWGVCISSDQCS